MVRVLHVIGSMNCGGAETLLMNIYRHIDRSKVQFDFVVHSREKGFYDDEIGSLGGKIYRTSRFNVLNYWSYRSFWNKFFREHQEYQIIHGHINSSAAIYLSCAKKNGRTTVVHSHATRNVEKTFRSFVFKIFSYPIRYIADYFFACSKQAGIDRFGEKVVAGDKFKVLINGIDRDKFKFNSEVREAIRNELQVDNNTVIVGHVGRFTAAKNHDFLSDVYAKIKSENPNSQLWLVGAGELEEEIRNKCQRLQIEDSVRFVGVTDQVNEYLQAMDVFVFPSIYEGFGVALVEAQSSGLPCVVSENIQDEADIGAGLMHQLAICDGADAWAKKVLQVAETKRQYTDNYVYDAGFDIGTIAKEMEAFYCRL